MENVEVSELTINDFKNLDDVKRFYENALIELESKENEYNELLNIYSNSENDVLRKNAKIIINTNKNLGILGCLLIFSLIFLVREGFLFIKVICAITLVFSVIKFFLDAAKSNAAEKILVKESCECAKILEEIEQAEGKKRKAKELDKIRQDIIEQKGK